MYCPICGQKQVSDLTRFCSKCGFPLTGISQVVANHGVIPSVSLTSTGKKLTSPRRRGLKQGLFILLLGTFLLVPLIAIITAFLDIEPAFVAIVAILSFVGGILRMVYALMFEDADEATAPNKLLPDVANNFISSFKKSNEQTALPPTSTNFENIHSAYVPPVAEPRRQNDWRAAESDTGEFSHPNSVTEGTTKLLERNE